MTREERQKERTLGWLRKTGFNFGKLRAGGAQPPESAIREFRRKPYTSTMMQEAGNDHLDGSHSG